MRVLMALGLLALWLSASFGTCEAHEQGEKGKAPGNKTVAPPTAVLTGTLSGQTFGPRTVQARGRRRLVEAPQAAFTGDVRLVIRKNSFTARVEAVFGGAGLRASCQGRLDAQGMARCELKGALHLDGRSSPFRGTLTGGPAGAGTEGPAGMAGTWRGKDARTEAQGSWKAHGP